MHRKRVIDGKHIQVFTKIYNKFSLKVEKTLEWNVRILGLRLMDILFILNWVNRPSFQKLRFQTKLLRFDSWLISSSCTSRLFNKITFSLSWSAGTNADFYSWFMVKYFCDSWVYSHETKTITKVKVLNWHIIKMFKSGENIKNKMKGLLAFTVNVRFVDPNSTNVKAQQLRTFYFVISIKNIKLCNQCNQLISLVLLQFCFCHKLKS